MVMKPSPAASVNFALSSLVMRMRQGAPGVTCSPGTRPSLSQRCRVDGATVSDIAAAATVINSPSATSRCRRNSHDFSFVDLRLGLETRDAPVDAQSGDPIGLEDHLLDESSQKLL